MPSFLLLRFCCLVSVVVVIMLDNFIPWDDDLGDAIIPGDRHVIMETNTSRLHIVSWNVRNWKAAILKITNDFGGLENWLKLLKIDILCIQEVKIRKDDINITHGATLNDYESFWCCLKPPSSTEKKEKQDHRHQHHNGFNGVTTFVRKGLVLRADSRALDDENFNDEGIVITIVLIIIITNLSTL